MWIDITNALNDTTQQYPGHRSFTLKRVKTIEQDGYMLSDIEMGAHIGTHIDSPAHFIDCGDTIECMPLELMTGFAYCVEHASDVQPGMRRVILTRQSSVSLEEAKALLSAGVRLVVVESVSVGDINTHKALLGGGCWVCESAKVNGLNVGKCELICVPLKIDNCEGAPARALVRGIS